MSNLRRNTVLFNEYHALIARVGKERRKKKALVRCMSSFSVSPQKGNGEGKSQAIQFIARWQSGFQYPRTKCGIYLKTYTISCS
jgi:hypothetical protein